MPQLKFAFKDDKKWSDILDDHSLLVQILSSDFFVEDERKPGEINLHALILWGLMLCAGDAKMKARVFYDVLQDSL